MFHRHLEIATAELRLLELHDAQTVFASIDANRQMLRVWLPWVDATQTVDDTRTFIEGRRIKLADQTELTAGIWLDNSFAGVIGVIFSRSAPAAEIGYWLDAKYQGMELVTAAVRATSAYLFEERGIDRIEIHCEPENVKSWAIPERLGFTFESTLHNVGELNGRSVEHRVYVLSR